MASLSSSCFSPLTRATCDRSRRQREMLRHPRPRLGFPRWRSSHLFHPYPTWPCGFSRPESQSECEQPPAPHLDTPSCPARLPPLPACSPRLSSPPWLLGTVEPASGHQTSVRELWRPPHSVRGYLISRGLPAPP